MKKLINIFILLLLTGCFYPLVPYKPALAFLVYAYHSYAIMENGKFNRMGIPKNDIDKMNRIINNKYGIKFSTNTITPEGKDAQIIFYDNLKMFVAGKEYILKKEDIKMIKSRDWPPDYVFKDIGIDIRKTEDFEYILDIGEIKIVNGKGKVIKEKTKIPPILFKKTYYVAIMYNPQATNYDLYYDSWAEDFPKDTTTLKRIKTTNKDRVEVKFPSLNIK